MTNMMKAMVITQYGGPEVLKPKQVPRPQAEPGTVVVRVRAFGLNHAEAYFRKGVWGDVAKISGIECVGEVHDRGTTELETGQRVVALMGGMGRSIDGSYAEYVRVPSEHVIPIRSSLGWTELAALPESYATAWVLLHQNLKLQAGQTLLVRGGTSALGQAAINWARHEGATVLATTRSRERFQILTALGAEPLLDVPALGEQTTRLVPRGIDGVLELVGNHTLLDSLKLVRYGGHVAMAGFLGGPEPIANFDPLFHLPSGVALSFFASAFLFGSAAVPMSSIPFQSFVDAVQAGRFRASPAHVFPFDELVRGHELMDSGTARGKIVIKL